MVTELAAVDSAKFASGVRVPHCGDEAGGGGTDEHYFPFEMTARKGKLAEEL